MKLIFISDNGCHHRKIDISLRSLSFMLLFFIMLFITYLTVSKHFKEDLISANEINLLNKFDSVLLKAGKLEAQVKRLNSLGQAIAVKGNIDIKAYLLSQAPAMGGIENNRFTSSIVTQTSLAKSIEDLELELELQEQRFDVMRSVQQSPKIIDTTVANRTSTTQLHYSIPVASGYVSSSFGKRRDPINGHQRHHNGIDIAAKEGSKIHTIASGFVTFSGRKSGYGNVIDIHHSDSLKSRYAHLNTIKVKKGEVVRKGDIIATMGQTGRATGSHLHLEVWNKDLPVNPESYIDTALIK